MRGGRALPSGLRHAPEKGPSLTTMKTQRQAIGPTLKILSRQAGRRQRWFGLDRPRALVRLLTRVGSTVRAKLVTLSSTTAANAPLLHQANRARL